MRIITGKYGGRRIHPPARMPFTRPTTDIAREGLFNVLQHRMDLDGISTLDLFGGTGSISYELASRGAGRQVIVEKDPKMWAFIRSTVSKLNIENCEVVQSDVFRYIQTATEQFDFIFAGPPYALANMNDLPLQVFEHQLLKPGGWFVLEHTPRNDYGHLPQCKGMRNYGTTVFTFFGYPE